MEEGRKYKDIGRRGERREDEERRRKSRKNTTRKWRTRRENFAFYVFSMLQSPEDRMTLYRLILVRPGTPQPLKKFVPSYETSRFVTASTKARHWSLS
jgi:hypothetical protein